MTRPLPKVSEPAFRKNVRSLPSIAPRVSGEAPEATSGTPSMSDVVVDAVLRARKSEP